jgi:predicted transcriptional regulator
LKETVAGQLESAYISMVTSMPDTPTDAEILLNLMARIVTAYFINNRVPVADVPAVISGVYRVLASLNSPNDKEPIIQKPAVSIRMSVTAHHIVCLEDGKKLKMLKRYLRSRYNLTPEAYRAKWGLPYDYPMVAPNYSAKRADLAKKFGLGRSRPLAKAVHKPRQKSKTRNRTVVI